MAAEPSDRDPLVDRARRDGARGRWHHVVVSLGVAGLLTLLGVVAGIPGNILDTIDLARLLVPEVRVAPFNSNPCRPAAREETAPFYEPGLVGLDLAVPSAPGCVAAMAAIGSQAVIATRYASPDLRAGAKLTNDDTCVVLVSTDQSVREDAVITVSSSGAPDLASVEVPSGSYVPRSAVGNDRLSLLSLPGLPEVGAAWTVFSTVTIDLEQHRVDTFTVTVLAVDGQTVVLDLSGAGRVTCTVPGMAWT